MFLTHNKKDVVQVGTRALVMLAVSVLVGLLAYSVGLDRQQVISSSIFIVIIMATLLFWKFRLAIAFVGIGALMGTNVLTLPTFIRECKLDVILFLVGMMVTVGVLKELGLFTWIIQCVIGLGSITGPRFVVIIVFLGALMACAVDEVTSIVFVATLIFQVCDTLKVRPIPFIIIAVLGTNIGSSGTMLGNPVGIVIGQNASPPLSFADFLVWSFPIMLVTLSVSLCVLMYWFRRDIRLLSERLDARREMGLGLGPLVEVPYKRAFAILVGMISFIALHHQLEHWLGLAPNTVLIVAPLVIAGLLMLWRHERSRHYIESDVEWWTLLFFMMLFAVAGTLEETRVTARIAGYFQQVFGDRLSVLTPVIIGISAVGSAFVDNIVFVAAFMPIVNKLDQTPLLWALLQGTCLGGNITMIGSTANIVALGMLEKRYRTHIHFFEWLKVGAVVGLVSCLIAWAGIAVLSPYMPTAAERRQKRLSHQQAYTPPRQTKGSSVQPPDPNDAFGRQTLDEKDFPVSSLTLTPLAGPAARSYLSTHLYE
ncbi:MAG TPA: SLC13 family permease [Sedimentisphaerales bacterium]|nr:SLC13 family permease [Sedimentisphaerales bacterium]